MSTYQPHSVIIDPQATSEELSWRSTPVANRNFLLEKRWSTVGSLYHIANSATGGLRNRTSSLICTDFRMSNLPGTITGLRLDIQTQRNGRAADEIIQLTYQGELIGNNNFNYYTDQEGHLTLTDQTVYGGTEDLWGAELTPEMLQDPSFGVVLKFQAHPYYPHSSAVYLDSVTLTVF